MTRTSLRGVFLLCVWGIPCLTSCAHNLSAYAYRCPGRLVAVGDIHGNYASLVTILQKANLIDRELGWVGANATLVQTGNFLDFGAQVRPVMDLLIDLQSQALEQGGQVVVLLGKHEALNLMGDFRDVATAAYAAFGDRDSVVRQEKAYREWTKANKDNSQPTILKKQWMLAHPRGWLEYRRALGPKGKYGRWLRSLPVVVKVQDSLFVHAGIAPKALGQSLGVMNQSVQGRIRQFDQQRQGFVERGLILWFGSLSDLKKSVVKIQNRSHFSQHEWLQRVAKNLNRLLDQKLLFQPDGLLQFQGYAKWSQERLDAFVPRILAHHGAQRIVVADPLAGTGLIQARLNGRIFLIQSRMSPESETKSQILALEIRGATLTGIYEDQRVDLTDVMQPSQPTQFAGPSGHTTLRMTRFLDSESKATSFQNDSQIQDYLRSAEVVSHEVIRAGINQSTRFLLEKDNLRVHAVFRQVNLKSPAKSIGFERKPKPFKDSCYSELAAYELNRMLRMNNLPPVVKRMIGGRSGSLQIWMENSQTLAARIKKGLRPSDNTLFRKQFWDMRVFDNLINNTDRNQGNILVDPYDHVWLIDHTRSFAHDPQLPHPEKVNRCSYRLFGALKELTIQVVSPKLKPWLTSAEISALFVRRDKLVRLLQDRIATLGDTKVLFRWD